MLNARFLGISTVVIGQSFTVMGTIDPTTFSLRQLQHPHAVILPYHRVGILF